jgi:hypothetical protein
MSSVTRPRGPLPRRVYWTRRALVAGVALLLVVGIAKVLNGGSNGTDQTPQANVVAGSPTQTSTPDATSTPAGKKAKKKSRKPYVPPLAQPSGPCLDSDVVVTPDAGTARAGGEIGISLLFTTKVAEACTFTVSPDTVVLKLTSGTDRIWSSQQCKSAVPTTTVIARKAVPGRVVVKWNGHRSNDACSRAAAWALPGYYHAEAAALGSDPTDVQFLLHSPVRPTITPKPKIKHQPVKKPTNG